MNLTSEIKTKASLLNALKQPRVMSPKDLLEQRVSFVFGSLDIKSDVTRDRVRQMILQHDGAEKGDK